MIYRTPALLVLESEAKLTTVTPEVAVLFNDDYGQLTHQKVNQPHYRPEVPRGFHEVKVTRLRDGDPGWW